MRNRVIGPAEKIRTPCTLCASSLRPGHLWIGGNDYIVCPDCEGTRFVLMIEERIQPPPTRVFLAGLTRVN